jgi:hypothetical protein
VFNLPFVSVAVESQHARKVNRSGDQHLAYPTSAMTSSARRSHLATQTERFSAVLALAQQKRPF